MRDVQDTVAFKVTPLMRAAWAAREARRRNKAQGVAALSFKQGAFVRGDGDMSIILSVLRANPEVQIVGSDEAHTWATFDISDIGGEVMARPTTGEVTVLAYKDSVSRADAVRWWKRHIRMAEYAI